MALHLVKLCVGIDSLEDLQAYVDTQNAMQKARGEEPRRFHTTRMTPRRREEVLDGGSLYWIIKGNIQCRSRILDLQAVTGSDGIGRCRIVMNPEIIPTQWQPRRAFQGWRYLKAEDAPADDINGNGVRSVPPELRRELADLGLL